MGFWWHNKTVNRSFVMVTALACDRFYLKCNDYNPFHLKCHNSINDKKVKARAQKVSFKINPG